MKFHGLFFKNNFENIVWNYDFLGVCYMEQCLEISLHYFKNIFHSKKITLFTIQLRSKNLTYFTKLDSLGIENNMLPQKTKSLSDIKVFQKTCFCLVSQKKNVLYHFLTPRNYILEALWKQMSVYFCISLYENFCSREVIRFCLVRVGLGLIKCFTIFHFNETFW